MKNAYPLTLAAAKKNESSLWELGDALLKECPIDSKRGTLTDVVTYLQNNGCEYSESYLANLRLTAAAFPSKLRRRNLAFAVHVEAETPQMLEAVIKGAPKGMAISHRYVRKIVERIRAHEERQRQEAFERAQAKRREAERKTNEKWEKAEQAKTDKERAKRQTELAEAEAEMVEARRAEKAARVPPKRTLPAPPPAEEDVPVLLAEASFMANAERAIVLAKEAAKAIKTCLNELTPKGVAGLTEVALEAANAWTEAAHMVRKEVVDQTGHLSVLEK